MNTSNVQTFAAYVWMNASNVQAYASNVQINAAYFWINASNVWTYAAFIWTDAASFRLNHHEYGCLAFLPESIPWHHEYASFVYPNASFFGFASYYPGMKRRHKRQKTLTNIPKDGTVKRC